MNVRPVILILLYAASTVMPAAHHLAVEWSSGSACGDCAAAGPGPVASCADPCSDPTHHHHPRHDEHKCVVCQAAASLSAHVPAPPGAVVARTPAHPAPPAAAPSCLPAAYCIAAPRAPPCAG